MQAFTLLVVEAAEQVGLGPSEIYDELIHAQRPLGNGMSIPKGYVFFTYS